jgi:hypothetical protein
MNELAFGLPADAGDQPFTDEELDQHLDAEHQDDTERLDKKVGTWQVDSEKAAEWAMRKLRDADREIAHQQALADDYHQQIDIWFERVTKKASQSAEFFAAHLVLFQQARLAVDPKAGSLKLPSGVIKVSDRSKTATVKIDDQDVFKEWAKANLPAEILAEVVVPQPEKVLPSKLKDAVVAKQLDDGGWVVVSEAGEPVPGAVANPGSLSITPTPEALA